MLRRDRGLGLEMGKGLDKVERLGFCGNEMVS